MVEWFWQRTLYKGEPGKCLHLYRYWIDPFFGFMGARIPTWFPFTVHLWFNGREWLSRRMDEAGIEYHRADNCFTWIEDCDRAQRLMDRLGKTDWPGGSIPPTAGCSLAAR